MVNIDTIWADALTSCVNPFRGSLATPKTAEEAQFLSEALSESDMMLDHLWIGAKKKGDVFFWNDGGSITNKSEIKQYFISEENRTQQPSRNCMGITRFNHLTPLYVPLNCKLKRPFICSTRKYTKL